VSVLLLLIPGKLMNGTGSRMVFASPAPVPGWDAAPP
jgi:hypothetical protein